MTPTTFDLKEAAQFLKMSPESLRRKAAKGEIPGAKPGKRWCFREEDLVQYLRSLYAEFAKAPQGYHKRRKTLWHSAEEATSGGSALVIKEKEYNSLLGLRTK